MKGWPASCKVTFSIAHWAREKNRCSEVATKSKRCRTEQVVVARQRQLVLRVRALDISGQATKGARGMSWHQKAMKGVEVCDKPGGVDKRAMILGFPN